MPCGPRGTGKTQPQFPGYHPTKDTIPTVVQILEGEKPSNTGKVFMERPPFTAMKYSGGGTVLMQRRDSSAGA